MALGLIALVNAAGRPTVLGIPITTPKGSAGLVFTEMDGGLPMIQLRSRSGVSAETSRARPGPGIADHLADVVSAGKMFHRIARRRR